MQKKIKELWQLWKEHDDAEGTNKTWCNYFVSTVAMEYGYQGFSNGHKKLNMQKWPMTANRMDSKMEKDTKNWIQVSSTCADILAGHGHLVVASQKAKRHGHVAIILPSGGKMPRSNKWRKEVPLCANIGGSNFWSKGVNWAFRDEPDYFLYIGGAK